jgi:hypothetical protein
MRTSPAIGTIRWPTGARVIASVHVTANARSTPAAVPIALGDGSLRGSKLVDLVDELGRVGEFLGVRDKDADLGDGVGAVAAGQ